MSVNKIISNIVRANWNLTDDFSFMFVNNNENVEPPNMQGFQPLDIYDMSVINIDMPQVSGDLESILQGGEYRLVAKKFQPFTITVTFRDFLGLKLRDYFLRIYMLQQTEYQEKIKSFIEIRTKDELLFESAECMIASVSQVQLDNSNTQISEFSVEFHSPYYTNTDTKEFGKYAQTGYSDGGVYE
jgi:hypothetical protein